MEFARNQTLLITQEGKLFDQVRVYFVEETGDARILHVISTIHTENRKYKIGEVRDETWALLTTDSLPDVRQNYNPEQPTLTLEIV